jgi:Transglycosylase SLT domain/Domain of unknown function (DUF4124)
MRPLQPRLVLFVLLLPLAVAPLARADIFGYKDERGVAHYSNVPVDSRFRLLIAVPGEVHSGTVSQWLRRSKPYSHLIDDAARANGLQPALIRAVLMAESGGDPRAVSPRGARGLMQLMPATARQYGVGNSFDPEQNIRAGSQYLRDLTDHYRNDLELVLAAYNAGPAAVDQHGGAIPPIKETLAYVPRVLQLYHSLLDRAESR